MSAEKPPARRFARLRGMVPFRGQRAAQLVPQARLSGPMPWVIAIMIALMAVASAGGLALSNLASGARADLAGGITVQVLEPDPATRDREAELAVAILSNQPGMGAVRRVPDSELADLLEPWLGELDAASLGTDGEVPIPALVDARLAGPVTPERLESVRAALANDVPSARVDAQSSWLAPVFSAIASLQWLALGLVALLALATIAAVWLAARSALGGNRDTIEILHLLGGTDRQVAWIFQRSVAIDAAVGGVVGLGLGLLAIVALGDRFADLGSGLVAGGSLAWTDWLLIGAIPLVGIVLAAATARLTVLSALRRTL